MTDETLQAYDVAASKLQQILQDAFPDCQWWVPMLRDIPPWKRNILLAQDRLEVWAKRDGYAAHIPCRTAAADDPAFARSVGDIAIFTMDRDRKDHGAVDKT